MPPIRHSEAEESNFLDSLFSELDSSAGTVHLTHSSPSRRRVTTIPQPHTPARATKPKSPIRRTSSLNAAGTPNHAFEGARFIVEHVDLDTLLDGAEDWDWDDMNSDFMTPRKSSPVKHKVDIDVF